jgi:hypothetical protein
MIGREVLVVHLMHIFTCEEFTAWRPRLTSLDELFLAFCQTHSPSTALRTKPALQRIMDDCESLLPRALTALRVGFRARSPMTSVRLIARAWRDGRDLLSQVIDEVGQDEETPLAHALVTRAMIPNFVSKSIYLVRCFANVAEQFTTTEMMKLGECVARVASGWPAFLSGCDQVTNEDKEMFNLF